MMLRMALKGARYMMGTMDCAVRLMTVRPLPQT